MAVYKIFPVQDTTLYSEVNNANLGLDALLYLSKNASLLYPSQSTYARPLVQFSKDDMSDVLTNYIRTASYQSYFKMYLCEAYGIPTNYTIELHPTYQKWDMGTGKLGDNPVNETGATWNFPTAYSSSYWLTSGFPAGVTGSFISTNPGGGTWYTSSYTQSFTPYTEKDIQIETTNFTNLYLSGSIPNYGFIVKTSGSLEFDSNYNYTLNFFSRDSNTIYPPCLEFRWDDSSFNPSGNICSNSQINVSLQNNIGTFRPDSIKEFRVSVRDQYPTRQFMTTSMFTQNKFLPSSSYWSLVDYKTKDVVIDYDTNYTKVSADSKSNYFTIYMNGLEPSRYYKILIKSIINGEEVVFDNGYTFKVEK